MAGVQQHATHVKNNSKITKLNSATDLHETTFLDYDEFSWI
jgi:hypothetical protein